MGKLVGQEIKFISALVLKTNIYRCAGCFSYIIFKEIKVGFEQEDLENKRKHGKQKSGDGMAEAWAG